VLTGAPRVAAPGAAAFAELVRELDAEHDAVRVELTGPWPPYSFAAVGQAAEQAPGQAPEPATEQAEQP
ncbi:GvpL/GvpF family gas vesicle protein, partial [Saccharomonospora xinjiangensis]|uniref:GvpL/GvpF family gas vesicle protein n=1 Tax=Saccharomonospora xinjiangensis TaxID=75294 RepID=UPI00351089E5